MYLPEFWYVPRTYFLPDEWPKRIWTSGEKCFKVQILFPWPFYFSSFFTMTREMFNKIAISGFDQGPQVLEANARSTVPQTSIIQISKVKKTVFKQTLQFPRFVLTSVTRWLSYYFNILLSRAMKFFPKVWSIFKVGSQFCQVLNSYLRKAQTLI